jgi:adenylate cyclase
VRWWPKKHPRRVMLGLSLTVLFSLEAMLPSGLPITRQISRQIELAVADKIQRLQPVKPDPRIVIVDIDERSLAEQGRWPWSREHIANLVKKVVDQGGARVMAFDVVFAEAEVDSDQRLVDRLLKDDAFKTVHEQLSVIRSGLNADQVLALQLKDRPVVLGYYFTADRDGHVSGALPAPVMTTSALQNMGWQYLSWSGYGANLATFSAAQSGFYSPRVDPDGLVRELPIMTDYRGQAYESLVSAVLRLYTKAPGIGFNSQGVSYSGAGGKVQLPLTPDMTALVPYRGTGGPGASQFTYVSASDVLQGKLAANLLKDKIVLVGTTALGLTDLRATPVNAAFPGVETHAALLSGALDGSLKTRPAGGNLIAALSVALAGLLLAFCMPRAGAIGVIGLTAFSLMTVASWYTIVLANLNWYLPIGGLTCLILALGLINVVAGYFIEGRSRRLVVERFGQYIAPQLVEQMANDPAHYKMDGANKELTMLFADIRGFTPIAESLDPQELKEFLNQFLGAMSETIHRHHGTVDKYMGDAVMAFWGAPMDDPNHAENAVAAAQAMLLEVVRLNLEFKDRNWPTLNIGIGINSGVVRVGDMGSTQRRAYTVIGDAVNVAARLESLTKTLDKTILVGKRTQELTHSFRFDSLGQHAISGKAATIEVFAMGYSQPDEGWERDEYEEYENTPVRYEELV